MDTSQKFGSVEEECKHWKAEARKYFKDHADCKEELDEFQESSQQLEAELEASLEQKEKQCRDLTASVQQMQLETESLYKRLVTCQSDYAQLEQRCSSVTDERDKLKAYTRQLEQVNDNLERELRVVTENVTGFEQMLNEAYEKNALLEMEVDDKEKLQVMLQRLKDESRDLKQELIVRTTLTTSAAGSSADGKEPTGSQTSLNSADTAPAADSSPPRTTATKEAAAAATVTATTCTSETESQTTGRLSTNSTNHKPLAAVSDGKPKTADADEVGSAAQQSQQSQQSQNPIKHVELNGNAMSASSRLSALNLVAELLRKVNVMEARLKACRNAMPPPRHMREAHQITSLTPPIMQHNNISINSNSNSLSNHHNSNTISSSQHLNGGGLSAGLSDIGIIAGKTAASALAAGHHHHHHHQLGNHHQQRYSGTGTVTGVPVAGGGVGGAGLHLQPRHANAD